MPLVFAPCPLWQICGVLQCTMHTTIITDRSFYLTALATQTQKIVLKQENNNNDLETKLIKLVIIMQ